MVRPRQQMSWKLWRTITATTTDGNIEIALCWLSWPLLSDTGWLRGEERRGEVDGGVMQQRWVTVTVNNGRERERKRERWLRNRECSQ